MAAEVVSCGYRIDIQAGAAAEYGDASAGADIFIRAPKILCKIVDIVSGYPRKRNGNPV